MHIGVARDAGAPRAKVQKWGGAEFKGQKGLLM